MEPRAKLHTYANPHASERGVGVLAHLTKQTIQTLGLMPENSVLEHLNESQTQRPWIGLGQMCQEDAVDRAL